MREAFPGRAGCGGRKADGGRGMELPYFVQRHFVNFSISACA